MAIRNLLLLAFLALAIIGCNRKSSYSGPIPTYTKAQVYQALVQHNVDFDWWVAKGKLEMESPEESVSGSTRLRIRKDSLVWMVGKKFAVEGMRMLVQPDSFWIKYPLERAYQRGRVDDFLRYYDLDMDYTDFQQVMAGNVMLPDSSYSEFEQQDSLVQLSYFDGTYQYRYQMHPYTLELSRMDISVPRGQSLTLRFDEYRKVKGSPYKLAHKRSLTVPGSVDMKFSLSEILINEAKKTPFSINPRYREIGL